VNILGILPQYVPFPRVGAWITTHEYLAGLHRRGHNVDVVVRHTTEAPYFYDGILVQPSGGEVPVPDVIVTHLGIFPHEAHYVASFGVPVVKMAHGHHRANAERLEGAALAVFSSQALADDTGWDGPQLVAHPPVRQADYEVIPGEHVTLSNLSPHKGGALFGRLAYSHPDLPFLGVLGYGPQHDRHGPNVTVIEPVEDMRTVYSQTRILLMASERESYGRVAVEAACSGIPTIAHPSPGLVEATDGHAIWVDRDDPAGWVTAIDMLRDPAVWDAASRFARRAVQTDPDATVDRVCDAIERVSC
jgi:hypothetical protein